MPDIIIKDEYGVDETYENVNTVKFRTPENTTVSFKYNPGTEYPYKDGQYRVRFLDYNGDVLKVQWVDAGDAASYPATNPQHEGLTFIGWNYTVEQLSDVNGNIDVGALYRSTSASGSAVSNTSNVFTVSLSNNSKVITLYPYYSGSLTWELNWGDGTVETKTVTSGSTGETGTSVLYQHTYSDVGDYTITFTKTDGTGTYWFGYYGRSISDSYAILRYSIASLRTATLDQNITKLGSSIFYGAINMISCVLPPNATGYRGESSEIYEMGGMFYTCKKLETITIPPTTTHIGRLMCGYCSELRYIVIPNSVVSVGSQGFYRCSLQSLAIPNSVTNILDAAFNDCTSLRTVTISSSVTRIDQNAFYYSDVSDYYFSSLTPPTLAVNALGVNSGTIIHVPASAVETYKTATNWTTYATRIVGY